MSNTPQPERPFEPDLKRLVDELKHSLPCCPNCDHFDEKEEVCTYQHQRVRPPAAVIAFGCWAYVQEIPF